MSKVFISYSHKDEKWKDRVVKHLRVLEKEKQLAVWDDRQIAAGDDWLPGIERAIQECDAALLLISVDFLDSGFILGREVPELLKRREKEGIRVIPVIVSECQWRKVAWLSGIQARPKNGIPLSSVSKPKAETALSALAGEVLQLTGASPALAPLPPAEQSRQPNQRRLLKPVASALNLLPLPGLNCVFLGTDNYKQNATFMFQSGFNLVVGASDSFLLGFSAHYFAPDGCACFNLGFELTLAGTKVTILSNGFSLAEPFKLAAGSATQIMYARNVQPPLMVQCPADCDYGDLQVEVSYSIATEEETVRRFYRFEPGGALVLIDRIREPSILSDSVVDQMHTTGRLSDEEYQRVKRVKAGERYQAVRFSQYFRETRKEFTPEYIDFLEEIHLRSSGSFNTGDTE